VPRLAQKLTLRQVASISKPGLHSDGAGLYLRVDPSGAKRWTFIFSWQGRRREMSLGPLWYVTLQEARAAAHEARRQVRLGVDPIQLRRVQKPPSTTFGAEAEALIEQMSTGWKSEKLASLWRSSLQVHAKALWDRSVDEIDTEDVLKVLRPIWTTKQETASKVRGRIERVLDASAAKGLRTGDNPARWQGHLCYLLAPRRKLTHGHRKALPYDDAPAFIADLAQRDGHAARALMFTILTAARENEVLGATWREVDVERRVWTVPKERMKSNVEHTVPLSNAALAVLGPPGPADRLIFPGAKDAKLSNMAMDMLLRRMGKDVTVHGFRSTFRDWAGDRTEFPREIAEAALAHKVGNAVEQAYRRSTALERRRLLMAQWAAYLGSQSESVVGSGDEGAATRQAQATTSAMSDAALT
jgi:integrase